jgi:hypothetical protein
MVEMHKKQKDDTSITVGCPDAISFYRQCMGGVDLADQMVGLYDLDRKSLKWRKKVFCRLLMFSAVNSWVIYKELNRQPKKPLLEFLVELAEVLIARGQLRCPVRRRLGSGKGQSVPEVWRMSGLTCQLRGRSAVGVQGVHRDEKKNAQKHCACVAVHHTAKTASHHTIHK